MRRIITTGATLAVLVGAAAAFAAASDFNSYTAKMTFTPSTAGSPAHPSPFAVAEHWTATGTHGHKTAPLTRIITKIYGESTDAKDFPVCTAAMINSAGNGKGWNKVCPKGSLIGQGPVESYFVAQSTPTAPNPPRCNPLLSIYNGGKGTYKGKSVTEQVFFFSEDATHQCLSGAVKTGAAPAYPGYVTQPSAGNGNMWTIDIPLPVQVSTEAGGNKGVYASLIKLDVTFPTKTAKVHGKTVAYGASIGCKAGSRPYTTTFYAQNYVGQSPHTQTTTVPGTGKC